MDEISKHNCDCVAQINTNTSAFEFLSLQPSYRKRALLGSGQFGKVFKGEWATPQGTKEVALKMLREGHTDSDKVKFLQEATIMAQFRHPHIIKLFGAVTVDEPVRRYNA